jgi:hypothetical protein
MGKMAEAPVSAKFSYRFLPLESPRPSPDLGIVSAHCPDGEGILRARGDDPSWDRTWSEMDET